MFELAELDGEGGLFVAGDVPGHSAVHGEICPFETFPLDFFDAPTKQCQFLVGVSAVSSKIICEGGANRLCGCCR
ncbi:hypothetical protein [Mycobacteroides abscessus]|uniref:Uncharacterized protein n=1 Tax=Mycobacteroides abscessus TaxID=36809 RepID=A0ABD7HH31_9MYCO|nr:hypothetical protein [Mycobacteroides abscessus]PVB15907.1 hypothetical protein DDJ71_22375 [Mycobacteroides abscessus]RIR40377.1 hypothetical protein D2E39_21795 [Mycobacteroides abscessus]RIS61992.1 hypothetical protein D2E43_07645 [Mycobacteroides abscessus]RIT29279.1 hypothetical protein D2E76_25585 [Mycobacteroides abscessus]